MRLPGEWDRERGPQVRSRRGRSVRRSSGTRPRPVQPVIGAPGTGRAGGETLGGFRSGKGRHSPDVCTADVKFPGVEVPTYIIGRYWIYSFLRSFLIR